MNWSYSFFFFPFFFFFSWQIEARDLVVISYENFKKPLSGESLKELEQLKENFSIELAIPLSWIVLRAWRPFDQKLEKKPLWHIKVRKEEKEMELQTLSKEEFAWKYAISALKEIRDE